MVSAVNGVSKVPNYAINPSYVVQQGKARYIDTGNKNTIHIPPKTSVQPLPNGDYKVTYTSGANKKPQVAIMSEKELVKHLGGCPQTKRKLYVMA